jgi:hypothetical protein
MTVDEIENTDFGAHLFNLYTREAPAMQEEKLIFSARRGIVRAMITAMLEAETKVRERFNEAG